VYIKELLTIILTKGMVSARPPLSPQKWLLLVKTPTLNESHVALSPMIIQLFVEFQIKSPKSRRIYSYCTSKEQSFLLLKSTQQISKSTKQNLTNSSLDGLAKSDKPPIWDGWNPKKIMGFCPSIGAGFRPFHGEKDAVGHWLRRSWWWNNYRWLYKLNNTPKRPTW